MAVPTMYFQHALDAIKGYPRDTPLDFSALLSANVTNLPTRQGMCAHVNASGQFELGAKITQMPIFMLKGNDAFDVANPGGTFWVPIRPAGDMSGLVATGAYELNTTEYNQTLGSPVYAPNDPLHSPTEDQCSGGVASAGLLFKAKTWAGGGNGALTVGTDLICGIVSRGVSVDTNGQNRLAFWPVFVPGTA